MVESPTLCVFRPVLSTTLFGQYAVRLEHDDIRLFWILGIGGIADVGVELGRCHWAEVRGV
jgi:hypothetical protein